MCWFERILEKGGRVSKWVAAQRRMLKRFKWTGTDDRGWERRKKERSIKEEGMISCSKCSNGNHKSLTFLCQRLTHIGGCSDMRAMQGCDVIKTCRCIASQPGLRIKELNKYLMMFFIIKVCYTSIKSVTQPVGCVSMAGLLSREGQSATVSQSFAVA